MMQDKKNDERRPADDGAAEDIAADDPHKVEKLTKAGRDEIDPNEGSD